METVRAFVAIRFSEEILQALERLQKELDAEFPKNAVRWTNPEQLHLTLKFLGNVTTRDLPDVTSSLTAVCHESSPFTLQVEGIGCFPNAGPPKVIWAGIGGDLAQLHQLESVIENAIGTWSAHQETRAFHPHLTLGRVKQMSSRMGRQFRTRSKEVVAVFGKCEVREILLMQSQLSSPGAKHSTLQRFGLARAPM